LKLSQFQVTNTLFDDNQPSSRELTTAILVQNNGSLPVNGSSYLIENNTFFQRPKLLNLGPIYRGVSLQSVEGAKCRNNTFTNQNSEIQTTYAAIRISNCRKLEIASNTINGINAPDELLQFTVEKESGISVEDAPENKITCNVINNVAIGMDFRNICSSTNLGENTFNNSAKFGLKLKEGAVIGAQSRRSNIWPTSSSTAEAFMEFVGFDPTNPAHNNQVAASRFTINSTSTNSSQFANPNIVGADVITGNPNSGWFKLPISTKLVLSQCGSSPGPGPGGVNESEVIDERETKIIEGEVFAYKGYAANAWEAEFNLFLRLASTPELTLNDATANNWFSQKSSTKIGNFANVYRGISTQINPNWVQLKYQLASQLAAITPNAQYESDLKSVMEICVNHLTDTIGFTDSEQITLTQIADKCRFEGGLAVVLARTALGQSSYRASECSGAWSKGNSEERNTIAQNSKLKVYPNPTQDFLNIEGAMITTGERSFFRLYDVAGNLILEERIIHSSQTINLSSVANGLYIATIVNNQGVIERQKLVINK
jgi:Secretion system C-terminal sorting domain